MVRYACFGHEYMTVDKTLRILDFFREDFRTVLTYPVETHRNIYFAHVGTNKTLMLNKLMSYFCYVWNHK